MANFLALLIVFTTTALTVAEFGTQQIPYANPIPHAYHD